MRARRYDSDMFVVSRQRLLVLVALLLLSAPFFARAQTDDLQTSVRAALLRDPRTASLTASQVDAMVQLIAGEATERGITARDIEWRPRQEPSFVATDGGTSCGNIPRVLCMLNTAFGFSGSDPTIAVGLGVTSGVLVLVIGAILGRRRFGGQPPVPPPFQ